MHIQRDFPGGPAPAQVVVAGPGVQTSAMQRAITGIEGAAAAGGPIHGPVTVQAAGHGRGMVISVPLAGTAASGNSSPAAIAGLRALRGHILPATVGKVHGVSYAVTGSTAGRMDYRSALRSASPLVFGIVAALAFVLLLLGIQVAGDTAGLDRAQPALGGRGLRPDHAHLPAGPSRGPARLHLIRRDHRLGSAVHVRVPVRPEHGLPRLRAEPDR